MSVAEKHAPCQGVPENDFERWYRDGADPLEPGGQLAFQRLKSRVFIPLMRPKFRVPAKSEIFMIGSCFLRGLELMLMHKGLNVTSAAHELFSGYEVRRKDTTAQGFTNKYNVQAIVNEIAWALDPREEFPMEAMFGRSNGTWVDPFVNPTLAYADHETTLKRRRAMTDLISRLSTAGLVIFSLTLNEVWQDTRTGHFLNMTPLPEMFETHPGRYRFHNQGAMAVRKALGRLENLLVKFGRPDVRILAMVCPVTMMATFNKRDVVLANSYCKMVLGSALQEWAEASPAADYFPAYEIMHNSDPELVWAGDLRHINGPMAKICTDLIEKFYLS